jgi:hypothetical protein
MVDYCAGTTVACTIALIVEAPGRVFTRDRNITALIVEEEGYVLTREENTVVPSANQGGKAREAELRSVASRAERGEEGLRLPRLLLAGPSMVRYCAGITAFSTFANSVLEAAFVHTTATNILAKYVETVAESSCIVVIHEPSIKAFTSNIHKYRDDE